jgi:hypothetical protein
MEYKIVTASETSEKLAAAVKQQMKEGWKPQGGLVLLFTDKTLPLKYFQAMIKE